MQSMPAPADDAPGTEPPPPATAADQLLAQAMQAHREGRMALALHGYEQALKLAPDHPDVLHMLGLFEAGRGDFEAAAGLISRAIAVCPGVAIFHNNLGNAYTKLDRLEDAEGQYRTAIILDSDRFDAMNNLGVLLARRKQFDDAEKVFRRLLELLPSFSDARQNLAQVYFSTGRISDAVRECAEGLVTAPHNRGLRHLLGMAYVALGWMDEAREVYRRWLEDAPEDPRARHHHAALTGRDIPDQASADYVRSTFDTFAGGFESKLAALDYRAPELVGGALAAALGPAAGSLHVVDAGCGTGLCARWLRPYAAHLVGVDLSGPMLECAAGKGAYDELLQADLVDFLESRVAAHDLVASADTLCYFGVLDRFASAARGSLRAGGWLFFTVEALTDGPADAPWVLQGHGRYAHRADYVSRTLEAAGFAPPRIEPVVLRSEGCKPVAGWLVAAACRPLAART